MEGTSEQQQPQGYVQYPALPAQGYPAMPYFYPAGYPIQHPQMYIQPGAYPYAFVPQQELPEMPAPVPVATQIMIPDLLVDNIAHLEIGDTEAPRKKSCSQSSRCRFVPWILFGLGFFVWFLWVVGMFWMRSRHTTARRGAFACTAMVLFSIGVLALLYFRHNPVEVHRLGANEEPDSSSQGHHGGFHHGGSHHGNHHEGCHGERPTPDDPVSNQPLPLSPIVEPAPGQSTPESEPSDDHHDHHAPRPDDHHRGRHGNDDDDDDDDHWKNHDNNRPSEHNHHHHEHHAECHGEPQPPVYPPTPVADEPSPLSPIVVEPISEPAQAPVYPPTPVADEPSPLSPIVVTPVSQEERSL